MPEPLWIYLMALLYFTKVSTCSTIAEVFAEASHDCLTRMLNGSWSGQTLLDRALRVLFTVVGGYLIVDDTVVEKPHAQLLNEAGGGGRASVIRRAMGCRSGTLCAGLKRIEALRGRRCTSICANLIGRPRVSCRERSRYVW